MSKTRVSKAQLSETRVAKETLMPQRMRGYWAMPDCRTYDKALMITPRFYLRTSRHALAFRPIAPLSREKDYWVMPVEGVIRPVKVSVDGQLAIGILAGRTPAPWPKEWDKLKLNNRQEYMACAERPALLAPLLARAMAHIDRLAAACHTKMTSRCRRLLFDLADQNGDGKISPPEMASAAVMLGDMGLLIKRHAASHAVIDRINKADKREADRLARRFMPKGGGLSFADFSGFMEKAQSKRLDAALGDLALLMPGVRP